MRITEALILAVYLSATSHAAAPVATWTPTYSYNVELVSPEDGQWQIRKVKGQMSVSVNMNSNPQSHYLYFKLNPILRQKLRHAYLLINFFDGGPGLVTLHYNTADNPYTRAQGLVTTNSNSWQNGLIRLGDTKFQGAQNGGADFRLECLGSPLLISKLEVYDRPPSADIRSDKERIETMKTNPARRGMFYTFGTGETDETTALFYRSLGITSIESYVTWETCEGAGQGNWDWSAWDRQVEVLKKTGLKWVPFLILGPAYSTPHWFRESEQHIPCRCLEHGIDSKIESLWNPNLPKWIERFIAEFAKKYGNSGVIESVLLGIQGDFGEAIYSVWGGGWTFNIPGEYHNHAGYWCDDPYALTDFRDFARRRYKYIESVNKAWNSGFKSFDDIDFPGRKDELAAFQEQVKSGNPKARRRWLDFIEWYRQAMTNWADWWIATTKKYFPNTPIYLCTGGDAEPRHGSNFAEQCRVAAKHGAGIRITNEASEYAANFVITRWVSSAGRHYGAFYGFEPAGSEDERGIVARIYNATASGANQLHDYATNVTQSNDRIQIQQKHLKYLFHVAEPIVPVALWYPNVHMTLHWGEGYFTKAATLRDYIDWDYVDETMLRTGALDKYKVLVILHGRIIETNDAQRIADWVERGGHLLILDVPRFESVEGTDEPERILLAARGTESVRRVRDWDELAQKLREILKSSCRAYAHLAKDGVYSTQIGHHRWLLLNTNEHTVRVKIAYGDKLRTVLARPQTITEVTSK